jgi:hypothetical protein
MDQAQDAQLTKHMNRGMLVLLGAGVSLAAFTAVIQGWHAFNAKAKIIAIAFLFTLVMYPMIEIRAQKRKQPDNNLVRFSGIIIGYTLILMAIIVFTGH